MKFKNWILLLLSLILLLFSIIALFFINIQKNIPGILINNSIEGQNSLTFKFLNKKDNEFIYFIREISVAYNNKSYIFKNDFDIEGYMLIIWKFNSELNDSLLLSASANVGDENIIYYLLMIVF